MSSDPGSNDPNQIEIVETNSDEQKPSVVSPLSRQTPLDLPPAHPEPQPPPVTQPPPPIPPDPIHVPVAIENVSVTTGITSNSATVHFDLIDENADPCMGLVTYVAYVSLTGATIDLDDSTTYDFHTPVTPELEINNLVDGDPTSLVVVGVNSLGLGAPSTLVSFTPSAPPLPPPTPPPTTLPPQVQNVSVTVGNASTKATIHFDSIAEDPTITPVDYLLYLTADPNAVIDINDPMSYATSHNVTPEMEIPESFTDWTTMYGVLHARNVVGDGPLSDRFFFRTTPPPKPEDPPDEVGATVLSSDQPSISFLPTRLIDEQLAILMQDELRRISPVDESKALQSYLKRPRLIHYSNGQSANEIITNLYRVSGKEKIQLPIVAMYRESTVQTWTEDHGINPRIFNHGGMLGFYAVRYEYRITVLAFEQPTLDHLILSLYTALRSKYRQAFMLEGNGFNVEVQLQILETDSITFTNEEIPIDETRLFASRCDSLAVGTYTYHLPTEAVPTIPVRYRFEQLEVEGNRGRRA